MALVGACRIIGLSTWNLKADTWKLGVCSSEISPCKLCGRRTTGGGEQANNKASHVQLVAPGTEANVAAEKAHDDRHGPAAGEHAYEAARKVASKSRGHGYLSQATLDLLGNTVTVRLG